SGASRSLSLMVGPRVGCHGAQFSNGGMVCRSLSRGSPMDVGPSTPNPSEDFSSDPSTIDFRASEDLSSDPNTSGVTGGASPFAHGLTPESLPPGFRYRLIEEIGRGGVGVVYRAYDTKLDRPVALKIVLALGHADEQQIKRFRVEVRAAAQ